MRNYYIQVNESKRGRAIGAFAVSTIIIWLCLVINNISVFYYDSSGYWEMSRNFFSGGEFHFDASSFTLRGYSWPLILAVLNGSGAFGMCTYWFLLSFLYGALISFGVGNLFETILEKKLGIAQRCVFTVLLLLFWPGLFTYPLSDMIAVFTSVIAVYFLVLLYRTESVGRWLLFATASGIFSDLALNIRATYKYNIYLGIGIIIIIGYRKGIKTGMLSLIAYVFGILLMAFPQVYANYINYGVVSIDNPLSYWTNNRAVYLLYEGALWPRYETYIGDNVNVRPAFVGIDPIISAIFNKEGISLDIASSFTVIDYVKLVFKYPVEFAGVYISHIINCLDLRYGELYISEFGERYLVQFISVAVYYMVVVDLYIKNAKRENAGIRLNFDCIGNAKCWVSLYILLPTLISLPGHIEPRYAISAHMLIFAYFAFCVDVKNVFKWIRRRKVITFIAYVLLFSILTLIQNYSLSFAGYGLIF